MSNSDDSELNQRPSPIEVCDRIYFPELDGLRFVAFMMVYFFHGGIDPALLIPFLGERAAVALRDNGRFGVQLFFILSGYLIATLLLREEARYGQISLRAFWIRRALRIWPLYYLILAIVFGLIPAFEEQLGTPGYNAMVRSHLLPFLVFLGNWSHALAGPIPDMLSVLWTVCVEEQFYLGAPLLIAVVAARYRRQLVAALIAAAIAARWICAWRYDSHPTINYMTFAQLDSLLSGVLLALVLGWDRDRPLLARWLRWLQWPLYVAFGWFMIQPHSILHASVGQFTWNIVWFWLCGLGVVIVAVWGQGWLRAALCLSWLVWLGKISYGLYMYHEIALWLAGIMIEITPLFPMKIELFTIACLALTIALAATSYYNFERRFLVLKRNWTRVPSRPV